MNEKKRIFLLALIMAVACMAVAGITMTMLHRAVFEKHREVLLATAQSQARLIEAVAKSDAAFSNDYPKGARNATIDQIIEAHKRYRGIGETGEFTLARREGENMVFLLSHRHHDFDTPKPLPMSSKLAAPMQRALSGLSGTMVGLDYRGKMVLAAYEPVAGLNLGIVAKIDLAEVRTPFVRAGAAAACLAIPIILAGAWSFFRITNPILNRLEKHSQHLTSMLESLQQSEERLQKARDELEVRVKERTAELAAANDLMQIEVHKHALAEQRLKSMWKIAKIESAELRELCEHILEETLEMTRSEFAFYGFLNPDESLMSVYSWSQDVVERCRILNPPVDFRIARAGIWANAVRERKALIINDYRADHPGKLGLPEGHVPLTRILVVPVLRYGRVVAVAAAANKADPYTDEDMAQLESFAGGVQGIIDQRKMESELRQSEKKYGALVENSLTGIYIAMDGKVVFANPRFAEIHGYSRDEITGMETGAFIHADDKGFFESLKLKRSRGEEVPSYYEIKGCRKDGQIVWTDRSTVVIEYEGKQAVLGNVVDITQRKQMEDALRKSEKECRLLSHQVMEAEEKERKRLAREIHDGIGQSLAAIKFRAEDIHLTAKEKAFAAADQLKSVIEMIQSTMEEMHNIHNELHPAYIEELGILKALSYFCAEYQSTYSSLLVEVLMELSEDDVPEHLKAPIYRIFQEAMNNAAKHSSAHQIRVCLQKTEDTIVLSVEDNGVGFETGDGIYTSLNSTGLGLYSMRERAELSGGFLAITSSPGSGTLIRATWPQGEALVAQ